MYHVSFHASSYILIPIQIFNQGSISLLWETWDTISHKIPWFGSGINNFWFLIYKSMLIIIFLYRKTNFVYICIATLFALKFKFFRLFTTTKKKPNVSVIANFVKQKTKTQIQNFLPTTMFGIYIEKKF